MRLFICAVVLTAVTLVSGMAVVSAQQAPAPPAAPAMKLFASSDEVVAMMAKAKAERKPDQAVFSQPIVLLGAYRANLEYRVLPAPPITHEKDIEIFYVVDGAGTIVTGGTLKDERRANAENVGGSAIEGGTPQHLAKGDFFIVPSNTPHWFNQIDGTLVVMSLHVK